MTYIDYHADAIRRRIPLNLLPEGDTSSLFRLYAVLARAKGDRATLEDVHDAWSAWMSDQNPQHRSLKPLRELPTNIRDADRPYLEAIHKVARERRSDPRDK